MLQINDAKADTLATLGYTGSIDNAYYNYLATETGDSVGTIQDLERKLFTSLGYSGSVQDMWFEFLRDNGFTNSLQDMLYAFWNSEDSGLNPRHFSDAYLPLTHTVVPTRGNITPSFTRATTETGQKYDSAGYLDFTALAGEVIFKGSLRIYNQWTTSSVTLASGGNKSLTLAAGTYQFSMGIGTGTATFSGTGGATGTLGASASARVGVAKTITAGTLVITASVADLADLQVCNITGETDQTTLRPYVSVGVESAPAYHTSCVDGVKCYPTDLNGNPIPRTGSYPLVGYVPWEARPNLQTYSNDLRNTAEAGGARPWTETGTGTCGQTAIGPDGTTSAWVLNDTGGAALYLRSGGNVAVSASVAYTTSVFVKKAAILTVAPLIEIKYTGGVTTYIQQVLNPVSGTVVNLTGSTAPTQVVVSSHNADYWRVSITATSPASTNVALISLYPAINTDASATLSTAAQGANTFYGVDIELGAFATPYIPTTTVAVPRAADILTYTGAEIANYKAMACTFSRGVGVSNVGGAASLNNNTTTTVAQIYLNNATALFFQGLIGGTQKWLRQAAAAYVPGVTSKADFSMLVGSQLFDKDGAAQTAGTGNALPSVSQIDIGHAAGAFVFNGPVTDLYLWTRALSQLELAAIDT